MAGSIELVYAEVGRVFFSVIRCILFGDGGQPRYGQTPPVGGVPQEDLLKAAAMVRIVQKF